MTDVRPHGISRWACSEAICRIVLGEEGPIENFWTMLGKLDARFQALALLANPAVYESVWPVLADPADEIRFWTIALGDYRDPVTVRIIVGRNCRTRIRKRLGPC
jgi:hypothetical protein